MNTLKNNWKRIFFIIWSGQAFSLLSSAIIQCAIIWWLTDTTDSAAVLAMASLAAFLPHGILGPFIGSFVDRYNRKAIMIIADSGIALVSIILAVWGLYGNIPIWLVMIMLVLRSIGTAFHTPALQASIPLIVPEDMLTKTAGYSQTLQSVSLVAGPALAAALYAFLPLYAILMIDVLGAVIAVLTLFMVHIPQPEKTIQTVNTNILLETKEGFLMLRKHKGIFWLTIVSALFMFVFAPINALFPLMSMSYFGGTSWHAGVVEIAFAGGMLAGSMILGAWGGFKKRLYSIMGAMVVMAFAIAASGALPESGFIIFALMSAVMGFTAPFYSGVFTALLQERIAPEYLGRVMSLSGSMMLITTPAALGLSGLFADIIGVARWFLMSGILGMLIGLMCLVIPSVRKIDEGAAPDSIEV